ncbi:MAG: CDP-diacylglycerol--glycerol-3-phosphate 3-phosphatidyltransferase [Pseudoalteromonas tetraodonis]
MNLPNKLTSARLVLTMVFVAVLALPIPHKFSIGLILFSIASFTDFLDGHYARKFGLITTFGKLMDPLADKILMCSAFVVLCEKGLIAAWIVVAILAREFLVTGIRLVATSQGLVLAADRLGKLKTIFQISTVVYFLIYLASSESVLGFLAPLFELKGFAPNSLGLLLIALSLVTTVVSGVNYLLGNKHLLEDC